VYMHIWSWGVSLDCKERVSVKVVMKEWACGAEMDETDISLVLRGWFRVLSKSNFDV